MAIAHLLRVASLALPLAVVLTTSSLSAQTEPLPAAADTSQPEVPLMQLEAPPEQVSAPPPPVSAPQPARPRYTEVPLAEAPLPSCDTRATPSPCEQPVHAYRHDGFYFRFSNETTYLGFHGEGPEGKASIKGLGSGGVLMIGGTPLPGLVIGGTLGSSTLRGKFNGRPRDADESDATIARADVGAFVDWFPQPDGGWHVGAAIGFGLPALTKSAIEDAVGASVVGKVFGGYDWWIGPQWSLGLGALFAATPSTKLMVEGGDPSGYKFYTLSAGLAASLTLH
jgi:hypothetical protein